MAKTHTKTWTLATDGGTGFSHARTYTGTKRTSLEETVADAQTNFEIVLAVDVSAVKSFSIVSDVDCLIETNNGTTPDDSISLQAGRPYEWDEESYDAFLLGTDVTSIFVTTAAGAATIKCEVLEDATP